MKKYQDLKTEQKKETHEQDAKRIKSSCASMKVLKDSKHYVLDEMKILEDMKKKLIKTPGANPYKNMRKWLSQELEQTISEIEVENALSKKQIDPSVRKDMSIRNEWEQKE